MYNRQPISKRLNDFINDHSFGHPNSYAGPDFSDYVVLIGTNRDADMLTQFNYEKACELFPEDDNENTLHIRQGHWACGWIELVLIKATGFESDINVRLNLYKAMRTREALDDYPVLDELEYSDYVMEKSYELYESEKSYWLRELCEFLDLDRDELSEELESQLDLITLYTFEADRCYCGEDDAYFVADAENLSRGIEYIAENDLMENCEALKLVNSKLKKAA